MVLQIQINNWKINENYVLMIFRFARSEEKAYTNYCCNY